MIVQFLLPLFLATAAVAVSSRRGGTDCKVPASAVALPPSLDPFPSAPNNVLLGVGVQNYTCNSTGSFVSAGAVAELFDISCLYGKPEFSTIQDVALDDWAACPSTNPLEPGLVHLMKQKFKIHVKGQHYFVNQAGTLVPVWDLRSGGNPNAIVFAQKVKNAPSPNGPQNVDWLELKKVSGDLASLIYRVDTVKGQPPSTTCTPGSYASVKYTSIYYFF